MDGQEHSNVNRSSIVRWAFWIFAAVGVYYLLTEHRAHVFDYLPFVLLMACPLMHMFGHGHGGHGHQHQGEEKKPVSSAGSPSRKEAS